MTVKIALIGYSKSMIEALLQLQERQSTVCSFVGISEINEENRKLNQSIPVFDNYKWMVRSTKPNAVIISASVNDPDKNLIHLVEFCAAKSIAILFEEQLASTPEEGETLLHLVQEYKIPAMVGSPRRFSAEVQYAKILLSSGIIGRPIRGTIIWSAQQPHDYFGTDITLVGSIHPVRKTAPEILKIAQELDTLRYVFGEIDKIKEIASPNTCSFIFKDTSALSIQFVKGFRLDLFISQTLAPPVLYEKAKKIKAWDKLYNYNCFYVFGSKGSLVLPGCEINLYNSKSKVASTEVLKKFMPENPYIKELLHFCEVVKGSAKAMTTIEEGLANLEIIDQLQEYFKVESCSLIKLLLKNSPIYRLASEQTELELNSQKTEETTFLSNL